MTFTDHQVVNIVYKIMKTVFTKLPRNDKIYVMISVLLLLNIQVGGALGLWLGLGVLQVLQEIIAKVRPFAKKCKVCGNV